MNITLRQIRYFVALAETGKVSLAGPAMNISSSAITEAVKSLEQELGLALVQRHGKGVRLTEEGKLFFSHCRGILSTVTGAVDVMRDLRSPVEGRIRLAVSFTVLGYFLPNALAQFRRTHPKAEIELFEMSRTEIENALKARTIDAGLLLMAFFKNDANFVHRVLVQSKRRLWLSPAHDLIGVPRVTLSDVANEPYIMLTTDESRDTTLRYWRQHDLNPNIVLETSSIEAVRSLVAGGQGVTILSDMIYRPWSLDGNRIEARPVDSSIPSMDVGMVWRRDVKASAPLEALLTFLTRFAEDRQT